MTPPAVGLLGGALLVSTTAPMVLHRFHGIAGAPRVGLVAWLGAALAALGMLVAAGPLAFLDTHLRVAVRAPLVNESFLAGCIGMLHRPGVPALAATLLATAAVVHVVLVLTRRGSHTRQRARSVQLAFERLGKHDPALGAVVVPYGDPVCFCLAGANPRIVISSGALAVLDESQVEAVLSHERAHLAGRHHVLTTVATGLARALPLPLFRDLPGQVELLVERAADERASRRCGRQEVASALQRMVHRAVPGALAATGGSLAIRMTYLTAPCAPTLKLRAVVALSAIATVTALGPVVTLMLACELTWVP